MIKIVSIESKDKGKRSFFCIDVTKFQSTGAFRCGPGTKKGVNPKGLTPKTAATYSPTIRSTIGAGGLNFSVRNGKRWDPAAIAT